MHLDWLQIKRVRNLSDISLEANPGINLITGENASGKTAILESIYLLTRARSFRTPRIQEVVTQGEENLQVTAHVTETEAGPATLGIEKGRGQMVLRRNGETVKTVSEQAKNNPIVLITPESQLLVTGTPKQRRHWLDWAMFHVEHHYLEDWRSYFKALRHRNALLKSGRMHDELYEGWENTLAETGARLQKARYQFVNKLQEIANSLLNKKFYGNLTIRQKPDGYQEKEQFKACLAKERARDRVMGFTGYGPHRDDVDFIMGGEKVAATFSRGQIKLFVSMLILAEAKVMSGLTAVNPVILVDDYRAELDNNASEYLLSMLCREPFQVFLTSIYESGQFEPLNAATRFHVEHGKLQKVV